MKVYETRYALSAGIIEHDNARVSSDGTLLSIKRKNGAIDYLHARDWCSTFEAAVARAEEMRDAKIKSLEKQIDKLRKLSFSGGSHD